MLFRPLAENPLVIERLHGSRRFLDNEPAVEKCLEFQVVIRVVIFMALSPASTIDGFAKVPDARLASREECDVAGG